MSRQVLIVGATGQQGKATIAALYTSKSSVQILALTRSASSPKAQALLSAYPAIVLVEGDTKKPEPIFQTYPAISSIFIVTVPPDEEAQAQPLIDAAAANKVNHIVLSSVDRGGDTSSWENPTPVPHFASKHRLEHYLRTACEASSTTRWTILRPTGFMDNYVPGFFGRLMATLWAEGMPPDRKMQLVSTHDIGVFAAKALSDPATWAGKAVGLAGDDLSFDEVREVFRRAVGEELPKTYTVLAKPVMWWVEEARMSFKWFTEVGYGADIEALRRDEPQLQTFETWLRESSPWKSKCQEK